MKTLWIVIVLSVICGINFGVTGAIAGNTLMKKQIISPDEIEVGEFIHCIEITECKMRISGKESKNVVTIYGLVVGISLPDIFVNVAGTFVSNLSKEGEAWVEDDSAAYRSPYSIGRTYPFRFKDDIIDDPDSTGRNQMYFEYP